MSPSELAILVRKYTNTDSQTFSDADMLVLANVFRDELCRKVESAENDYFTIPQFTNIVATQREYEMPSDMLNRIRRLEVKLKSTDTSYTIARTVKFNIEESATDETSIQSNFSDSEPKFYILRRSIWLLTGTAIEAMTDGLKVWSKTFPDPIVSMSSTIDMSEDPTPTGLGFPRPLHEILARRLSIIYKSNRTRPIPLTEHEQIYNADLEDIIGSMTSMDKGESIEVNLPYNTGSKY